jgi:hypothetical protein
LAASPVSGGSGHASACAEFYDHTPAPPDFFGAPRPAARLASVFLEMAVTRPRARAEIRVTTKYKGQEMSLQLSVIGWDSLTPQGIRFGIATILALLTVGRPGPSALEFFAGIIFILGAGLMVAQAVSLG